MTIVADEQTECLPTLR